VPTWDSIQRGATSHKLNIQLPIDTPYFTKLTKSWRLWQSNCRTSPWKWSTVNRSNSSIAQIANLSTHYTDWRKLHVTHQRDQTSTKKNTSSSTKCLSTVKLLASTHVQWQAVHMYNKPWEHQRLLSKLIQDRNCSPPSWP